MNTGGDPTGDLLREEGQPPANPGGYRIDFREMGGLQAQLRGLPLLVGYRQVTILYRTTETLPVCARRTSMLRQESRRLEPSNQIAPALN